MKRCEVCGAFYSAPTCPLCGRQGEPNPKPDDPDENPPF